MFNGLDLAGFEPTGARVASAGGQFRLPTGAKGTDRTDAAFQLIEGRNITDGAGFGSTQNTGGFWAAVAWEGAAPWSAEGVAPGYGLVNERQGGLRLQGNVARSISSADGSATGMWADASWRTERWRDTAGLFRFEPSLRWGTALLASDIQGAYWQADTSTRALTSPGEALQLTWDNTTDWGQTQWRGDIASAAGARTTRLGIDQSWPVAFPNSLNTSLAWERTSGNAGSTTGLNTGPNTGWIWGVLGTLSPYSQWSLALRYTQSRGQDPLSPLVVSALTTATLPPIIATQASQSLQRVLRYEESAGRASAPTGGGRRPRPVCPASPSSWTAASSTAPMHRGAMNFPPWQRASM